MALEIDIIGELFDATFKGLGKYGIWLNANGKRLCFIVWGLSECAWCVLHWKRHLYSQAIFAVIGVIMYAYGYWKWSEKQL